MLDFWPDLHSAETWIRRARWVAVPLVALQGALAHAQTPAASLVGVWSACAVLAALESVELAYYRRRGRHLVSPVVKVITDIGFLAICTWFMQPAGIPGFDLLAIVSVPAALSLRPPLNWVVSLLLMVLHNVVVISVTGAGLSVPQAPAAWLAIRTCLSFNVATTALTIFAGHVRGVLEERQSRLQRALDDHNRNERLVALGMLAARIAHELGTPLSSIDLLAGEAIAEPDEAKELLTTLRGQVQRCREILDRIRGTTSHTVSEEVEGFATELRKWVADWQGAGLDRSELTPELSAGLERRGVRGDAGSWRGILWSLLDNAYRAGGPITVTARLDGAWIILEIDDSGAGPSAEVVALSGTPFFTSWSDSRNSGRGLGLFVARSFAARWGGDVVLTNRKPSGGRVTVRFATL